jgi:FkbM family methyltransferase
MQDRDTYDIFLYGYRPTYGDTVVDLGAGIGSEVRVLSRLVGPSGRVISIEAHPRIFHCLCRTIKMNSLDNVTPLQYAVTGQSGFVLITDDMESHIGNGITTDRDNALEVPAKTLAEILYDLSVDKVDLLKMNIEGAELEVLESAFDTLPVVRNLAVSCHDFIADDGGPDRLRTFTPVRKLLTEAGYGIRTRPDDRRPWVPYYLYASR